MIFYLSLYFTIATSINYGRKKLRPFTVTSESFTNKAIHEATIEPYIQEDDAWRHGLETHGRRNEGKSLRKTAVLTTASVCPTASSIQARFLPNYGQDQFTNHEQIYYIDSHNIGPTNIRLEARATILVITSNALTLNHSVGNCRLPNIKKSKEVHTIVGRDILIAGLEDLVINTRDQCW